METKEQEAKDNEYNLIPMSEIDAEARKIAVLWVEGFEPDLGFQINQRHKLASDLMNYANQKISDFQAALIEALEKDKLEYTQKRDGWKEGSPNYETYHLVVRICDNHISLVKTVTLKKK